MKQNVEALELANWLNESKLRRQGAHGRVENAIEILRKSPLGPSDRKKLLRLFKDIRINWSLTAGDKIYMLDESGERVKVTTGAIVGDSYESPVIERSPFGEKWESGDNGLILLANVTEDGALDNLRTCKKCGNWFAASKRHQRFCSEYCQQWFWADKRKTEEGRKIEAARVARWRELQQEKKRGKK